MTLKEKYKFCIDVFSKTLPDAQTELHYRNGYELLVSVVLSAQCTDKRVNMVTPAFFAAFPDPKTLAAASVEDIFSYIKSISYPNNKAKHLHASAHLLMEKYGGEIPRTVPELIALPGVGRKTANVITSVLFEEPNMAVDTHVFRVSKRIGLVSARASTPLQVEKELTKNLPKNLIYKAHHWLILHGRYTCLARKPKCESCALVSVCNYYQKQQKAQAKIAGVKK